MGILNNVKSDFTRNLINLRGFCTTEKLLVIESDDWGTIRMSNKDSYEKLLFKGYKVDQNPYSKYDSLESNDDLLLLYDVLNSVRGIDGNPAKFTINNIVANPDFEKIKNSNFQDYYWEPFTKTLERYPNHDEVMRLYHQGISEGFLKPQFHGREHLNVKRWMTSLQNKDKATHDAFEQFVFSPRVSEMTGYTNEYMDALDYDRDNELASQEIILKEGLSQFYQIWGFNSKSFIAPCYIWDKKIEKVLAENGVDYIQGMVNQLQPKSNNKFKYKKIYHYQGQLNKWNQRYLIRNAFFEPSIKQNFGWEEDCLNRIEIAFRWRKPAIISSHRLNYMGSLHPENRAQNLKRLQLLLAAVIKKWPEIRFVSSDELGDLMNKKSQL
ncbi:polysaccharide (de)acetylase [Flavobacterium sp.]|uniref:polysaccharide (de)acetylase n=1 Tax=Flavobacterium sp. TaxID=239 RepID=UPI004048E443